MAKVKLFPVKKSSGRQNRNFAVYFSKGTNGKNKIITLYKPALQMAGLKDGDSVSISYDKDRNTIFIEEDKTSSLTVRCPRSTKAAKDSAVIRVDTIPFDRFHLKWPSKTMINVDNITFAPGCITFIWPI